MKRGVAGSYGMRGQKDDPVDYRFAALIDEIQRMKWPVNIQLTNSQLAEQLEVARTTILYWKNRRNEVSRFTAARFLNEPIWTVRGYFSRKATEIHSQNLRTRTVRCKHPVYDLEGGLKSKLALDVVVLTWCQHCGTYYNMFRVKGDK